MAEFEPIFSGLTRSATKDRTIQFVGVGYDYDQISRDSFKYRKDGRLCSPACACLSCISSKALGANFEPILVTTFNFEGKYDANPVDSGNYNSAHQLVGTNYGISAIAYETFIKRLPTVSDMKAITPDIAKQVYKKMFWDKVQGDSIKNQSVALGVFDVFVNSGNTGLLLVRRSMNKTAGKTVTAENSKPPLTPTEVSTLNSLDQKRFFNNLKTNRLALIAAIIEKNPAKQIYEKGWTSRVNNIIFDIGSSISRHKGISITGGVFIAAGIGAIIFRKQISNFIKTKKSSWQPLQLQ